MDEMEQILDRLIADAGLPCDDSLDCAEQLIASVGAARSRGRVRRRVIQDAANTFDYVSVNKHRVGEAAYEIQFGTRRLGIYIKMTNVEEWTTEPKP